MNSQSAIRIVTCLAFAISFSILSMVGWFIASQPSGAFRNIVFLHPISLIKFAPVGVIAFIVAWLITRKCRASLAVTALIVLAASICLWYFVQSDPLSSMLLPPIDHK